MKKLAWLIIALALCLTLSGCSRLATVMYGSVMDDMAEELDTDYDEDSAWLEDDAGRFADEDEEDDAVGATGENQLAPGGSAEDDGHPDQGPDWYDGGKPIGTSYDDGLSGVGVLRGNTVGNLCNWGYAACTRDHIYFSYYEGQAGLYRYDRDSGEVHQYFSSETEPICINILGDYAYYMMGLGWNEGEGRVYRYKLSTGEQDLLYDQPCTFLAVNTLGLLVTVNQGQASDKLFFLDENAENELLLAEAVSYIAPPCLMDSDVYYMNTDRTVCLTDVTGKTYQELPLSGKVRNFCTTNGFLYYTTCENGSDAEVLRRFSLFGAGDEELLSIGQGGVVLNVCNAYVYYIVNHWDGSGYLNRLDLATGNTEQVYDGIMTWFNLADDEPAIEYVPCDVYQTLEEFEKDLP